MKRLFSTLMIVCILGILTIAAQTAQDKVVLVDVSHGVKSDYTDVNAQIFEQYYEIVEKTFGATLIINEGQELDDELLARADVVIILSPLSSSTMTNLSPVERESLVDFVKTGKSLILFADEDRRMDIVAFGGNDIVTPFGMKFGGDLPRENEGLAISFIGEFIKGKYEMPYSGSRELTGGIPLSVKNAEGGHVHGAYAKLENGGKIAAFGETMVGLFMGEVEMNRPDGGTIVWGGKDNKQFMLELIGWMLED